MEAKSIDKKTFQLTEDGQLLGELTYENIIMLKAEIKLANSEVYQIKPVGFFGTSIIVTKHEKEIANLKLNWHGQIVFAFQDGQKYIFKAEGMFLNKFTTENMQGEKLIQFDPKFEWRKFNYSYNISYDQKPEDILIILLGVYAANYLIATMSGYS